MSSRYILNAEIEVRPSTGDGLKIHLPTWGRTLEASRYEVGLLEQFTTPNEPDKVVASFPFHKEQSRRFLARCAAEGFLLELGSGDKPVLPDRVLPPLTIFNSPAFDAARPPALVFLGIPFDGATTGLPGARFGPAAIRQASAATRYQLDRVHFQPIGFHDFASGKRLLEGIHLADAGDVFFPVDEDKSALFDRVTRVVGQLRRSGAIPVILGGDHSLTFPVLRAFGPKRLGIIHLDAHSDLGSSHAGGVHHGSFMTEVIERLDFVERVFQIGLRGVVDAWMPAESTAVTPYGVDVLRSRGIQAIVDRLPAGLDYYLTLDIDVLDPAFAPATGTPVPGGLLPHELKELLRAIASQRSLVGWDVMEVAQTGDPRDGTAGLALDCIFAVASGTVEFVQKALELEAGQEPEEDQAHG